MELTEPKALYTEHLWLALTPPTLEERLISLRKMKAEIFSIGYDAAADFYGVDSLSAPDNLEFAVAFAQSQRIRNSEIDKVEAMVQRSLGKQQRQLMAAEQIGFRVVREIHEGTFGGVRTDTGIIQQISAVTCPPRNPSL
ncbi:MAG: hypothetical protein AAFQ36_00010 [Pseudomonadota bacterium]